MSPVSIHSVNACHTRFLLNFFFFTIFILHQTQLDSESNESDEMIYDIWRMLFVRNIGCNTDLSYRFIIPSYRTNTNSVDVSIAYEFFTVYECLSAERLKFCHIVPNTNAITLLSM